MFVTFYSSILRVIKNIFPATGLLGFGTGTCRKGDTECTVNDILHNTGSEYCVFYNRLKQVAYFVISSKMVRLSSKFSKNTGYEGRENVVPAIRAMIAP